MLKIPGSRLANSGANKTRMKYPATIVATVLFSQIDFNIERHSGPIVSTTSNRGQNFKYKKYIIADTVEIIIIFHFERHK